MALKLIRLEERIVLDGAGLDADSKDSTGSTATGVIDAAVTPGESTLADVVSESGYTPTEQSQSSTDASILTAENGIVETADYVARDTVTLLVVSSDIDDASDLLAAVGDGVVAVSYDADSTTLAGLLSMMQDALDGAQASSIGFAVHGSDEGSFALTSSEYVNALSLFCSESQRYFWQQTGDLLSPDGRVDVLACDLAASESGQLVVSELEYLTGHEVAASSDATGNSTYGGDWVLETDAVDAAATYFSSTSLAHFDGLLADADLDSGFDSNGTVSGTTETGQAIVQTADGIYIASTVNNGTDTDFAVTRYNIDGTVDNTFGTNGTVITDFGGNEVAHGIAADGTDIVVVGESNGDFAIARYTNTGLDATFGTAGKVTVDIGGTDVAYGVAVDSVDNDIVIAGTDGSDFALVRLNSDGSMDGAFNAGSFLTVDLSGTDIAYDVAIDSADQDIVVAGTDGSDFALARVDASGVLDNTFDADGKLTVDLGGGTDIVYGIAIDTDSDIVAVGTDGADIAIARINSDGTLDGVFGATTGKVTTDAGGTDVAYDVAIDADDSDIVIAGSNGSDFLLARYDNAGALDTGFDTDGILTTDMGGNADVANGIIFNGGNGDLLVTGTDGADIVTARCVDTSGALKAAYDTDGVASLGFDVMDTIHDSIVIPGDKLLVAGTLGSDFAVARYNADGSLDATFGTNGIATADFGGSDVAYGLTVDASGRIILVGNTDIANGGEFAIARFTSAGVLDTTFDGDGMLTDDQDAGRNDIARAVYADGNELIVAGETEGRRFLVTRYDENGTSDAGFTVVDADMGGTESVYDMAVSGSNVVVVGTDASDFAVLVVDKDTGTVNSSFSGDGKLLVDMGGTDIARAVTIDGSGKIVVAGTDGSDIAVARIDMTGALDTAFSVDGKLTTDVDGNTNTDIATGVMIQDDGKIVVTGQSGGDFAVLRYSDAGALDAAFGGDGMIVTDMGSTADIAMTGSLRKTGEIVVAGYGDYASGTKDIQIAQYDGTFSDQTPVITNLADGTITYNVGAGEISLDAGVAVTVDDPSLAHFNGGELSIDFGANTTANDTLTISGVEGSDLIYIKNGNEVWYNSGTPVQIGTFVGGTGLANLVVTFNADAATDEAVAELIKAIRFNTTETDSNDRTVTFTLTDADLYSSAPVNVTVVMNAAPVVSNLGAGDDFTYNRAQGAATIDTGTLATIVDADATGYAGGSAELTVQLAGAGFDNTEDVLSLPPSTTGLAAGAIKLDADGTTVLYSSAGVAWDVTVGTMTWNSGTGLMTVAMAGTATDASVQALLRNVTYENTDTTAPSAGVRTASFTLKDATGAVSNTSVVTVTVNAAPVIANLAGDSIFYNNGDGAKIIDAGADAALTDGDSTGYAGSSAQLTAQLGGAGFDNTEDVLSLPPDGTASTAGGIRLESDGVTVSYSTTGASWDVTVGTMTWNASSGLMTVDMAGTATEAAVQALLRNITYENSAGAGLTSGDRTVDIAITDADGGISLDNTVTITVNTPPTLGGVTYEGSNDENTINSTPQIIDSGVTLTDTSSADFDGGSITLAHQGAVESAETLSIISDANFNTQWNVSFDGTNVSVSFDGASWTVVGTLDGTADGVGGNNLTINLNSACTAEAAQAILRHLTYKNTDDSQPTSPRTFNLTVSDGDEGSSTQTFNIAITPQNDAPEISGVDDPTFVENTLNATAQIIDADVTFSDSDNVDFAGGSVLLAADASGDSTETLGINSNATAVAGNIQTVSAGIAGFAEDTIWYYSGVSWLNIGTVDSTADGQAGNGLKINLSANATAARVDALIQNLTYRNTENNPVASRAFTLTINDGDADDGAGNSVAANFNINITAENDVPVFTGLGDPTIAENTLNATPQIIDSLISLSDADNANFNGGYVLLAAGGGGVTTETFNIKSDASDVTGNIKVVSDGGTLAGDAVWYCVDGGTSNWVQIGTVHATDDGVGGNDLRIELNADATAARTRAMIENLTYQNTDDSPPVSRDLNISINDGSGAVSDTATISITAENDAPVMGAISGPTYNENTLNASIQLIDSGITFSDPDGLDFDTGSLSVVYSGSGSSAETISIVNDADAGTQWNVRRSGLNIDVALSAGSWTTVGTVPLSGANSGLAGNSLVITFNANATAEAVQAVLKHLGYKNTDDSPVDTQTLDVTVNDGDGASASRSVTMTITDENDAPVLSGVDNSAVNENTLNSTEMIIDSAVSLSDGDELDFDSGYVLASINGGGLTVETLGVESNTSSVLGNIKVVANGGTLDGDSVQYYDGSSWVEIGIVNGTSFGYQGADLRIDLNANATAARVEALVENLTYQSNDDSPDASRTINITVYDGDGGNTGAISSTVNITAEYDAPAVGGAQTGQAVLTTDSVNLFQTLTVEDLDKSDVDLDVAIRFDGISEIWDMVRQSDGKYVVVGYTDTLGDDDFALARYNSNGTLDTTFGNNGFVVTDFGGSDHASSVAIDGSGKIVVAGTTDAFGDGSFAIARYNSDGTLDTSLDGSGMVVEHIGTAGSDDIVEDLAIDLNGDYVVVGYDDVVSSDVLVARFDSTSGSLDTTFSGDGKLKIDMGGDDYASAVAIDSSNRIVVSGGVNSYFGIFRYNSNGSLDTTFAGSGRVLINLGTSSVAYDIAIGSDSMITAVGEADGDFAVVRYTAAGAIDTTLGGGTGYVIDNMGGADGAYNVALAGTSSIIVSGVSAGQFAVARYAYADGSLDAAFSGDGHAYTTGGEASYGMVVESGGAVVLAGFSGDNFALTRMTSAGAMDATFASDGIIHSNVGRVKGEFTAVSLAASKFVETETAGEYVYNDGVDGNDTAAVIQAAIRQIVFKPTENLSSPLYDYFDISVSDGTTTVVESTTEVVATDQNDDPVIGGTSGTLSGNDTDNQTPFTTVTIDDYDMPAQALTVTIKLDGINEIHDSVLDGSGRIIVAGYENNSSDADIALARYLSDGTLDTTFGDNGRVGLDLGGEDIAYGIAIDSSGRIVVVGETDVGGDLDVFVARFSGVDGSLDTTFNGTGYRVDDISSANRDDSGYSVAIGAGDNIVVAGVVNSGSDDDALVARFLADGSGLDTGFSGDGIATFDAGGDEYAEDVAIYTGGGNAGKILIAGSTDTGGDEDVLLRRYNADGSSDTDVQTDIAGASRDDAALGLTIDSNNKAVVAGYSENADGNYDMLVARYTDALALDTGTFGGGNGYLLVDFSTGSNPLDDVAYDVAVDSTGKVVASGSSNGNFAVIRLTDAGVADTGFSGDGFLSTNMGGTDVGYSLVIEGDNDIVVAGGDGADFAVARYASADGSLDTTFSGDGKQYTDWVTANHGEFTAASLVAADFIATGNPGEYKYNNPSNNKSYDIEAAIRLLVFNPADNISDPGTVDVTRLTIKVYDGVIGVSDDSTIIESTSVNDQTAVNSEINQTTSYTEGDASVDFNDIVVTDPDYDSATGDHSESVTATLTLANTAAGSLTANDGAAYDGGTGQWTITGTVSETNAALANLKFIPVTNNDVNTTISVDIRDGLEDGGVAQTGTISLNVTGVNDQPSATNLAQNINYNEDSGNQNLTDIVVTDVDTGESITAILVLADSAAGSLTANDGASYDSGTGTWSITGTVAQVNTALANVQFVPAANNEIDTSISVYIMDGGESLNAGGGAPYSQTLLGTINLDVNPINDQPLVSNINQTINYMEDQFPGFSTISVTDPDIGEIITATLTVANPAIGSLSANDGASYNVSTGVWTITGSVADVNTALANMVFTPEADSYVDNSISVNVSDGLEDGSTVQTGTITLNVSPVNDGARFDFTSPTVTYTKGDAAILLDGTLGLSDPDDTTITGASVRITGNYSANADYLLFENTANITATWDPDTGILGLTGTATIAEYQAAFRSVKFQNISESPSTAVRTITFSATDVNASGASNGIATGTGVMQVEVQQSSNQAAALTSAPPPPPGGVDAGGDAGSDSGTSDTSTSSVKTGDDGQTAATADDVGDSGDSNGDDSTSEQADEIAAEFADLMGDAQSTLEAIENATEAIREAQELSTSLAQIIQHPLFDGYRSEFSRMIGTAQDALRQMEEVMNLSDNSGQGTGLILTFEIESRQYDLSQSVERLQILNDVFSYGARLLKENPNAEQEWLLEQLKAYEQKRILAAKSKITTVGKSMLFAAEGYLSDKRAEAKDKQEAVGAK